MDVMSISHSEDLDGIAAATLIRMKYGLPADRVMYIDYSTDRLESAGRWVESLATPETTLFITDLSVNDSKAGIYKKIIMSVKSKGGKVIYLDHHPWSETAAKEVAKMCDHATFGEQKLCASELTAKYLKLKGEGIKRLLHMCHLSDNNIKAKSEAERTMIRRYSMAITYYNTLPEKDKSDKLAWLSDIISKGDMENPIILFDADEFERASKERTMEMLERLIFVGKNIAVGFADTIQPTYAASLIFRKAGRPIAIYVNTDLCKGSIRSTGIDISGIARSMGGGGHPCAAGFEFSKNRYDLRTERGRSLLIKRIESTAKELGLL
jgi:oligoribonuclease NrnB/cAMP/cGMP phosphodiesterase (DHH superfamily)